jgi:S-DNA-T family DNA segregation ATPase FtsK/SpoIIIE
VFEVGLTVEAGFGSKDILLRLDDEAPAAQVYEVVKDRVSGARHPFRLTVARTATVVPLDGPVSALELRWGDRLLLDDGQPPSAALSAPYLLVGVEGPALGLVVPLTFGETEIGRELSVGGIKFVDPMMSRHHARLQVSPDGVVVTDQKSTNGTWIDDVEATAATRVPDGSSISFGDSGFLLESHVVGSSALRSHLSYHAGLLGFNRQPRLPDPEPTRDFRLPTVPDTAPKRRLPMATAIVPVVLAFVMWKVIGSAAYLLMAAMGPAVLVFNVVDDRRVGRKKFAEDESRYRREIEEMRTQITSTAVAEKEWSQRRWPAALTLAGIVADTDARLWWRRPTDTDFLDLRVGSCDQPSRIAVQSATGGMPELADLGRELSAVAQVATDAPALVHLHKARILGVVGSADSISGLGRSILLQLAALHSPRDLALAVIAPGNASVWEATKWLPHARALDESQPTLAFSDDETASLVDSIRDLVATRRAAREESFGSHTQILPHVVVLVQPPLPVPRRVISQLLGDLDEVGVSIVWLAPTQGELPGECRTVVQIHEDGKRGSLWETGGEQSGGSRGGEERSGGRSGLSPTVELIDAGLFRQAALSLAPLRDTSAGSGSGPIPSRVDLLPLLDLPDLTPSIVRERWAQPAPTLSATIGDDGNGPVIVDLDLDGPHTLVAGTTGAGKSEFLQTLVASLALSHSPARINFILVDYKGGSAFQNCRYLPHTVGFVTDLDGRLAARAMRALNAEMNHREHVITTVGGAKDLTELRRRSPSSAPPSLVIIVDEFAFLKNDVPEFVDQLVDVAQRGRSLGVHLILATQRPSGVISDNIQANTNLRIALRVQDASESSSIIGRGDAAGISKDTPGRALVRTGHSSVQLVQSAYVGADSTPAHDDSQAAGATFVISASERRAMLESLRRGSDTLVDLDRIVAAITEAWTASKMSPPRRPWLDELPSSIPLDGLPPSAPDSVAGLIGIADLPDEQTQQPWLFDLDHAGNYLIYGGPGSGKSTALRTIAIALARAADPTLLNFYGLDFGQGSLRPLSQLPHWGGTASNGETARTRRLIELLQEILAERSERFGQVGASSVREFRAATGEPMAEIVVLIDNYGALAGNMDSLEDQLYLQRLQRLIADGRPAGFHFVITASSAGAVPQNLVSAVHGQLVLALANPGDYAQLGRPELAKAQGLSPGRAFARDGTEIQLARVLVEGVSTLEVDHLVAAINAIADTASGSVQVPQLRLLPEHHSLATQSNAPSMDEIALGIDEQFRSVNLNLWQHPLFLIAGPPKSGRTTALATLICGVREAQPGIPSYLLTTRRSDLADLDGWTEQARSVEDAPEVLARLVSLAKSRCAISDPEPILVVIDDGDDLAEGTLGPSAQVDQLQRSARDAGVVLLAAVSTQKALKTYSSWLGAMRANQHGLLLAGTLESAEIFSGRIKRSVAGEVPPGRGYLFSAAGNRLIQVGESRPSASE